jgi:hypothetical protein
LAVILWFSSAALRERGMIEAPTTILGSAVYTAISAVACVLLAFAVIFVGRLLFAPVHLYWAERDRADLLSEKEARKPRLRLNYAAEKTQKRSGGSKQSFLFAINESGSDVSGAQVKIEEAKFRRRGADLWEGTSIVARTNMSWGFVPEEDSQKYGTVPLAPGKEPIDFITGPVPILLANRGRVGFKIRIDPRHLGNVIPFFWEAGTYRFEMQISATDAERAKLTLFVDWDGQTMTIRSENPDQILETANVLPA